MKMIDLTIPLGIGTPPWPTYEPLQVKYFKRLAPNGANGQIVTHSNHIGTHLDGEIHFYTPGKDIASLDMDFLVHEGAIVDRLHAARSEGTRFVIINPGAFTHTSVAIRDAFAAVAIPFCEVHISNVHAREEFRRHSFLSDLAVGVLTGFGAFGYTMAMSYAIDRLTSSSAPA